MSGIVVLLFLLLPIVLLAVAGGLGVASAIFFSAAPSFPLYGFQKRDAALGLGISIPVIAAAAVLLSRWTGFADAYGPFLEFLWLWSLCAFALGLAFGWGFSAQAKIAFRFFAGVLFGVALGSCAAFLAASLLLMPPANMVRWIGSNESVEARLARVFNPEGELLQLRTASGQCRRDLDTQQKRADDLEFKAAIAEKSKVVEKGRPTPAKVIEETCIREIHSLKGIRVNVGESSRQLGGRIYIAVRDNNYIGHWCHVVIETDTKKAQGKDYMKAADAIRVHTSIGTFKVVVTKAPSDLKGPCEFDLLRD